MNENAVITRESTALKEKYYYIRHKSGLDIYVFPKKLSTTYALFGTRYGSIDNTFRLKGEPEYTVVPDGIAHFLEHKMFENEDGEDTFLRYARTGASANAYTGFNITAYLFSCTANFSQSLEILLDFVTSPYFTPETVAKEQGIIAQEIRMGEDNPDRALLFGMLKAMYARNNVRLEIAGTVESISKITADVLYKCYHTFYNLSNMALCVSGDVTVDEVLAAADRVLKAQPELEIESVYGEEPAAVSAPRFTRKMQVAKPLFAIGIKDIVISSDPRERMRKNAALTIMDDILFGRSSTFYNELYAEGLISGSFGCWSEHNRAYSFNSVSGESRDPEEVYRRFCEYMETVKRSGISEEDFERARRVLYSQLVKSFDSTEEIANNFLGYIFDGGDIFDFVDIVAALTREDVMTYLRAMFQTPYYTLAVIEPLD